MTSRVKLQIFCLYHYKIDSGFKKYTLLFVWNIDIHQITGE